MINPILEPPDKPLRTSGMFEEIREYVPAFEKSLRPDQEVGIMLAAYGPSVMIVTNISFRDPALFVFRGLIDGKEAVLIQHRSQLNFVLTAMDIPDNSSRPGPIGFSLDP